MHKRQAEYQV